MVQDAPGIRINGKYELVQRVGTGGMATVWQARTHGAKGFSCMVALKRIREELRGQPHIADLFVEEARVDAALRHPNIVQVHDFGVDDDGEYYLVTEWIEGIHLEQYTRSFALAGEAAPYDLVALVGIEVLRALDAAHRRKDARGEPAPILHRDVTPQNILLDEGGFVKLADFGMARAADRGRMTHPDIIKGKISYLAPEMTKGIGPNVQTDVYAVGIVLWEALTGERLFDAPTDAEVFRMLMTPRVPLLAVKRPDLPLSLAAIIHRALETDPVRRFQSAGAMLHALIEDVLTTARPAQPALLAASVVAARDRLRRSAPGRRVHAHSR